MLFESFETKRVERSILSNESLRDSLAWLAHTVVFEYEPFWSQDLFADNRVI